MAHARMRDKSMSYDDDKPWGEILAARNTERNADITTEEFRQLLAEEITPEDIYRRRRKARWDEDVKAEMELIEHRTTRDLLNEFRQDRFFRTSWWDEDQKRLDERHELRMEALRRILATREHIETNSRRASVERRDIARRHHGPKKPGGRRDGGRSGRVRKVR